MLSLSCKEGESIIIDGGIVVTVLGMKGSQVRLGFKAPKHIRVYREKIYQRILEENKRSAESTDMQQVSELMNNLDQNENNSK